MAQLDNLRVVLVRTRNPLNIGAAARAMSNFGCLRLRVVQPYETAFRNARSAVHAESLLATAEEYATLAEAVGDCTIVVGTTALGERELLHPLRTPMQGAPLLREQMAAGGCVALVFGSEKTGLSKEDLSHCHWLLRIPTREAHDSMNLGQAVAVCLYELARDAEIRTQTELPKLAASAELERLVAVLLEALETGGYVAPGAEASTREKVRRLLRRTSLEARDAEVLLGMLRQILWKLRKQD